MSDSEQAPGRIVGGRYELGECIGTGGMGQVFRATDKRLDRTVAIKILHSRVGERIDADKRFHREARIGAQLSHENLVQTYDFGRDGEGLFLAMEFLEGRDLSTFLREHGPLTESQIVDVAAQVSAGLAAAHAKDLVHRDLKPENIFLVSEKPLVCKVVDFGMAVASANATNEQIPRLTLDGTIGGTPHYMAPEQLRGEDPIASSDVYALGCVLFEVATGAPPYNLDALGELAAHHLYAPVPEISAFRKDIAPLLCELVRRCLSKKPSLRPTMEQISNRLSRIYEGAQGRRHTRRSTRPPRDERAFIAATNTPTESMPAGSVDVDALPEHTMGDVAIRGTASSETIMALSAAGFRIVNETELHHDAVLLCFDLTDDEVAGLCQQHAPIIADAEAGDMVRVSHLLRVGVSEVLTRPICTDTLITKLRRTIRIHARSKQRNTQ